jgi:hypothetical protein
MAELEKDEWYAWKVMPVLRGGYLRALPGEDSQRSQRANASESADHGFSRYGVTPVENGCMCVELTRNQIRVVKAATLLRIRR